MMVIATLGNFTSLVMHLTSNRTVSPWWQHLRFPHTGECESEREGVRMSVRVSECMDERESECEGTMRV